MIRAASLSALFAATALYAAAPSDRTLLADAAVDSVYFSADGKTVTASYRDDHIRTWDVGTGKVIVDRKLPLGGALLSSNVIAEPGDSSGKTIRFWDLTAERQMLMVNGAMRGNAAISGDQKQLAIAEEGERLVRVVNLDTGEQRQALADGLGGASALLFSPDGSTLVSANYDTDVRIWKTQSGELVRRIEDLTGAMFAAEFTPDGRQLVMGGLDETVYILDAQTYEISRTLKGHGESIAALAISPDGRTLVTGGFDVASAQSPVKIVFWDLATGTMTRTVRSPHRVASLAFSPDSRWLAMTSIRGKEISLLSVNATQP
jgi:DNA-binding beta-propeller fold protein YncE